MRLFLSFLVFTISAAILGGAALFMWGHNEYQKPGPLTEPSYHIVKPGQGVSAIADDFAQKKIIGNPLIFRIAARINETHKSLKAGEYELPAGISMAEILEKLERGETHHRRFTIPEGYTSWQITEILKNTEHLTGEITTIPAEGTLLPETYHFTRGDSRAEKIQRMQMAMQGTIDALWAGRASNLPIKTKEEAVILASIVEKETGVASERKMVAGVFINRLRKRMLMQSDPTVIYAMTMGKIQNNGQGPLGRRLLRKDLQLDSPYNTYEYPGLPPGPIANPGKDAIAAVLNPAKHKFIYFVADGKGGHAFAETLAEHNNNVAQWRKIRKSQAQKP